MYQLFLTMLNEWKSYAGANSLFMDYVLIASPSDKAFFGALNSVNQAGSPKYDAMISEIFPAGDAEPDGTVNFADFQVLEQYYGDSSAPGPRAILTATAWSTGPI